MFIAIEIFIMICFGWICIKLFFKFHQQLEDLQGRTKNHVKTISSPKLNSLVIQSGKSTNPFETWWNQFLITGVGSFFLTLITKQLMWLILPFFIVLVRYYFLIKNARLRKWVILKRIPFVLDILTLNLESGLDFISSLEELVKMNDPHPLVEEIKITLQNIKIGESRAKAFEKLGTRTGVVELAHLASSIQQSESMGSSLTDLLRLQSQEIRYRIFKQAETEAQKAPVKILIPMLLFIFPVVFVILFVPIGIQLFTTLK